MDGLFEYSSFFENKKAVTLGEIKEHFGFLQLRDLRKIVDDILAFEGSTQAVSKSTDTIVLTPKRIETILKGIQIWQSDNEKSIIQRGTENIAPKEMHTPPYVYEVVIPVGYMSLRSAIDKYGRRNCHEYIHTSYRADTVKRMNGENYIHEESLIGFINNLSSKIKRQRKNPLKSRRKVSPRYMIDVYKDYIDK